MKQVISLGAGVQSSTMALMAARGELPTPDCAIFADTGAEPKPVYDWLDWLEGQLPFPVHRVERGDLREAIMRPTGKRFAPPPFYTTTEGGREGMLRRQCTREYKVEPLNNKLRELVGLKPRQRGKKGEVLAEVWIGISLDEAQRMKPHKFSWARNIWPLIDRRMSRHDCLRWMETHGYPRPPKSACTFCPYHDDAMWLDMKRNDPESFADAVAIDEKVRTGFANTDEKMFVHRSLVPLKDVEFDPHKDQVDMFGDECEGMCGV